MLQLDAHAQGRKVHLISVHSTLVTESSRNVIEMIYSHIAKKRLTEAAVLNISKFTGSVFSGYTRDFKFSESRQNKSIATYLMNRCSVVIINIFDLLIANVNRRK